MLQTGTNEKYSTSGVTLWFTGLSGAGKSTIANKLKEKLKEKCLILDGDVIRKGLNKDLGFSREDRKENIRRISEVSKLFNMAGFVVIVAFISPYSEDRKVARELHLESNLEFKEIFINASLECCEKRDVKGLYKKARNGEIKIFTGVSDIYEAPSEPDLIIDTESKTLDDCVNLLIQTFLNVKKNDNEVLDGNILNSLNNITLEENAIVLDEEELNLLQIIQQGWCAPELNCFMNEEDLMECLYFKTFKGKYFQPMPIICPIGDSDCKKVDFVNANTLEKVLKIINKFTGKVVAVIENPNYYYFRREEITTKLFGTFSNNHPKIKKYFSQGNYLLTGKVIHFLEEIRFEDGLDQYRLSPESIRKLKIEKNADCLYAFQVRNPLHNGHCMLLTEARNKLIKENGYKNPILLLHPCGGWTKDDDVPLQTRVEQYKRLLEDKALDEEHTILAVWPSPMFYAGPMEVLWHFASREYAGVDFMIVGRDPAGIKHPENSDIDLYDATHGQKIIEVAIKNKLLNLKSIPFKPVFYNKETKEMEFFNHSNKEKYLNISGTELRRLAREGLSLPDNFMNEKGWQILKNYYKNDNHYKNC
jgi:3'-phosphoadenosine 5'-phosphosulfate synthase